MNYETFRAVFEHHLRETLRLPVISWANETLDLHSMDRTYSVAVEPIHRGDAEPFHIAAEGSPGGDDLRKARRFDRGERDRLKPATRNARPLSRGAGDLGERGLQAA